MAVLQENLVGGKGAEFSEYFRGNMFTRLILGNIYPLHLLFLETRCAIKSRLKQKNDFLTKTLCIRHLFSLLCREFADSMVPRGHYAPSRRLSLILLGLAPRSIGVKS